MTRTILAAAATAVLLLGACQQGDKSADAAPAAAADDTPGDAGVQRAAGIARGVNANPGAVDSVLAAHGTTAAELDSLMYEIAADSARAAAYAQAVR
jgi:hypothetical protein